MKTIKLRFWHSVAFAVQQGSPKASMQDSMLYGQLARSDKSSTRTVYNQIKEHRETEECCVNYSILHLVSKSLIQF